MTVVVRTARGRHLYFRHNGDVIPNSAAKLHPGQARRREGLRAWSVRRPATDVSCTGRAVGRHHPPPRDGFGSGRVRKPTQLFMATASNMVRLIPGLPRYASAGIDNPLGARALYLYQGGRDILFRIHGTNEPWKIGQAASSGCIRMLNEDVVDLYDRVPVGATVLVKRGGRYRA